MDEMAFCVQGRDQLKLQAVLTEAKQLLLDVEMVWAQRELAALLKALELLRRFPFAARSWVFGRVLGRD